MTSPYLNRPLRTLEEAIRDWEQAERGRHGRYRNRVDGGPDTKANGQHTDTAHVAG